MGNPDQDVLVGTEGDDVMAGLAGNDTINGWGGDDVSVAALGTTCFWEAKAITPCWGYRERYLGRWGG
jgi:Ca2+-binding RTX toxin-like protein